MFNVHAMFSKMFPRKKVKTNRTVTVPQSAESKEDLKLDFLVNLESILKQKKIEAVYKMVTLVEDGDLSKEEQFRDVAKAIGLDFEVFDCDELNAYCAAVEWSDAWHDVYVKDYNTAFDKLLFMYYQICEGNYTCYPDVSCEEDLVDELAPKIRNLYCIPEYLEEYICWDSFVKALIEEYGGVFNQYGYFNIGEIEL